MTLLIFDCDGVLVDSEHLACEALAELMTTLGHSMTADQAMLAFAGRSLKDVLARAERLLSRPIPRTWVSRPPASSWRAFAASCKAVAGVKEAIAALPYRRCVASSSEPRPPDALARRDRPVSLFGNNVFSAVEVANGKPAPDLFLLAARRLGEEPSSCIVIEDSVLGVEAAGAAGMAAIGFRGRQPRKPGPGRTSRCRGGRTGSSIRWPICRQRWSKWSGAGSAALDPSMASEAGRAWCESVAPM